MRLLKEKQKVREVFPLKQFNVGQKVHVRVEGSILYEKNLRVYKIDNERVYEVQDQDSGNIYEVCVDDLFTHCSDNPEHPSRYASY